MYIEILVCAHLLSGDPTLGTEIQVLRGYTLFQLS